MAQGAVWTSSSRQPVNRPQTPISLRHDGAGQGFGDPLGVHHVEIVVGVFGQLAAFAQQAPQLGRQSSTGDSGT